MDNRLKYIINKNKNCEYLKQFNIDSYESFKKIPIIEYKELIPFINKIKKGDSDILFKGKPESVEKTSGTLGAKYIYYSEQGIKDLKKEIEQQYFNLIKTYNITGKIFFALSPFWFNLEKYGELTVGLKDESVLSKKTLIHFMSNACIDNAIYATQDYNDYYIKLLNLIKINQSELGLISIWSPSYLINLLNDLESYDNLKNNKKLVISCWKHGFAKEEVKKLQMMLPFATIVPKGLFLTEGLITNPVIQKNKVKFIESKKNFIEYLNLETKKTYLLKELEEETKYEVILTNNNGLYRYNTHDIITLKNKSIEFISRSNLNNDFAGEKISEEFLSNSNFNFFMYPEVKNKEYIIFIDKEENIENELIQYLNLNPHWVLALNHKQIKFTIKKIKNLREIYFKFFINKNAILSTIKKHHLIKSEELFNHLEENS